MKVKCYCTAAYRNTDVYDVDRITAMPEPDELDDETREYADGIMLCLDLSDGRTIFCPHSFLISIDPA